YGLASRLSVFPTRQTALDAIERPAER
ncbi:MAG: hypothetical protein QOI71_1138, partial [Gaiellales bacterium]|nr:hypothetical protein [Gaiellales bacterium]